MNQIYRGYDIDSHSSPTHPIRVSKDNIVIYVCKTEDEAYKLIDQSKRELAQAAKG